MRPAQLLAGVVALSSLAQAWPDVFDRSNAVAKVHDVLYGRQDNNNNNNENAETEAPAPQSTAEAKESASQDEQKEEPTPTDSPKETGDAKQTGDAKETSASDDKQTASGSEKPTNTKGSTKSSKPPTFDNRLPAGGIAMITPAPLAGQTYYKIGDWVTFAWNYTSLSVTPSAIDILATCTANQATYTLAVNQTVEETGMVLWDTGAYQETASVPLLTEKYTLIVYDSNSEITAMPKAGYLGVFNQFTFGMYTPQPYVKWTEYTCPNCNPNGALSPFESLTLRMLLITCGTTFASLFYFAFSFGVL